MKAVRMSANFTPQEIFLVIISVGVWGSVVVKVLRY